MFVFTIGEMIAHPKFISYVGIIAPHEKKALYQGYSFLYGVIGSGVGGILGAFLYVRMVEKANQPGLLWITFSMIGLLPSSGCCYTTASWRPKSNRINLFRRKNKFLF